MSKNVYTLKHPVERRNAAGEVVESYTELTLRRLKGRDLRALDSVTGAGSSMLALLAASAGLPPSVVDEMDAEDITVAGEIVSSFMGGSLPTGAR